MPDGSSQPGWQAEVDVLLSSGAMHSAESVLSRPSPVPASAGVYAWYFNRELPGVPLDGAHVRNGHTLLYVGISPKAPPSHGGAVSRQTIRKRIRYHYRGNAAGSTLRLTLGCLLTEELGISLCRVGSGNRMTFADGEAKLSRWMADHAQVVWVVTERQWELEHYLIRRLTLPFNLDQNRHSAFHATLTGIRSQQRTAARISPIVTGRTVDGGLSGPLAP